MTLVKMFIGIFFSFGCVWPIIFLTGFYIKVWVVRKRFLALLGKAHGAVYGSSVGINGYEPNKNTWNKRPTYIAAPGRRMRIRGYSVLCGQLRGVDPERGGLY